MWCIRQRSAVLRDELRKLIGKFRRNERGNVGIAVSIAAVPMIALAGVGVDMGRSYMVRHRLTQALDAAALAGGRALGSDTMNADIQKYFYANLGVGAPGTLGGTGFMGASFSAPSVSTSGTSSVTVSASATIPTTLLNVLSGVCTSCSEITVNSTSTITRAARGMELALVLDNTGSMASNGKMQALKDSANSLLTQLYGSADTQPNLYVGVVPFVAQVNIGTSHADWTTTPTYTQYTVSSLTRASTKSAGDGSSGNPNTYVACATTSGAHGFKDGMLIDISGASQSAYNGRRQIRTTSWPSSCSSGSNKFWYMIDNGTSSAPATPATGTIKANRPTVTFASGSYTQSNGAWRGCVEARDGDYDNTQADASPTTQPFKKSFWPSTATLKFYDNSKRLRANMGNSGIWGDNDWASGSINEDGGSGDSGSYGPNKGCPSLAISPLQQSKATVQSVINSMTPWYGGGTNIPIGLAWGWRMLSPNYRGLWGSPTPSNLPLDYNTSNMEKVLVLLTDGRNEVVPHGAPGCDNGVQDSYGGSYSCAPNESDYTAYGRLTEGRMGGATTTTAATEAMNARIASLCTAIKGNSDTDEKNDRIKIYTIILQETDGALRTTFEQCASKPEYAFFAPSTAELANIFTQIGDQLSSLRISK